MNKNIEAEKATLSPVEKEAILLAATFDLINGAVNHEVLEVPSSASTQVIFASRTHFNFFFTILIDFLSPPDKTLVGRYNSYLDGLKTIADSPTIGSVISASKLKNSVASFLTWLDGEFIYEKAWFPTISMETDLKIRRADTINICSNVAKHNFIRLTAVSKRLQHIFKQNGHDLNLHQSLSIVSEFQEQFHGNVLWYHSTSIVAFLSEIQWAIYEYLKPTYEQSFVPMEGKHPAYRYEFPADIEEDFARECFWNLMNNIRSGPYVSRFTVSLT